MPERIQKILKRLRISLVLSLEVFSSSKLVAENKHKMNTIEKMAYFQKHVVIVDSKKNS
jgi:hypothetical protein